MRNAAWMVIVALVAIPAVSVAQLSESVANARRIVQKAGLPIQITDEPSEVRDVTGKGRSFAFRVNGWYLTTGAKSDLITGLKVDFSARPQKWEGRPPGRSQEELIAQAEGYLNRLGLTKGRDYQLESVVDAGDPSKRLDSDAVIGAQRITFGRPDYLGFKNSLPVATFTILISTGELLWFNIASGIGRPPYPITDFISVNEAAIKAREAAITYLERIDPKRVNQVPEVAAIEKTVSKVLAMSLAGDSKFPMVARADELRTHYLPAYSFRVGSVSVTVRADNGDILGGGLLLSSSQVATAGKPSVAPEVLAAISGAPVVPAEPAPAPVAPASAPVASPSGMPVSLVAVAGGAFALILGAWAMWGRKR